MLFFQGRHRGGSSGKLRGNDINGQRHHADVADLGHQGHGPGGSGVGLQHVHLAVFDGVLHIHQALDMHLLGDLSGIFLDGLQIFRGNVHGRNDAGGVSGMDACQLNVLHDRRHKGVGTVADGIRLTFHGVVQETVDEDGAVRGDAYGGLHISHHALVVVHHFHAPAAQHVGGAHHHRIADLSGNLQGFFHRGGHAGFRHGNRQFFHHFPEQIPIFRQIDDCRGGAQDLHPVFLQFGSQVQRRLSAELSDDAYGFFFLINAENVLQGQRLKIQLVGGVVVRGHGLRVAVDDNRLKSQFFQGQGRVNTAVVKLDALADAVGAAAQDHHLGFIAADGIFVLSVVGGIIVGAVRSAADVDALPVFLYTQSYAAVPDVILRDLQQLA